ncbi:ATP-binding cassette domain-containing protein [Georgenia yuyongxinii]|uniref:ATP-binding cassette domain-containing protein n=1 Tax=Georgenia yuyongxinii TaxID=2589797 RepID=UPI001C8F406D|nr:ATP-binding cassette domain-containing protein [Georgenia yuyongxinii]
MRATDLAFAYPGSPALFQALSFDADGGELLAVTGPSGSGKSTLLSLLGGWLAPSVGVLEVTGVERLALVPQNPFGVPGRTALDHVCLPLIASGLTRTHAAQIARGHLELLKLEHAADRPYRMLSGGERQRMLLARALASGPDLLLVDEPTAQLDTSSAAEVCDALASLERSGVLVFVATHDPRVVDACSRVLDLLRARPQLEQENHAVT